MPASSRELRLLGKVLTPSEEQPRSLLVIHGGRIASLEPWPGEAPPGTVEVDGWLAPGFIDLQVNGFAGQDFANSEADMELASRKLAEHGVTAFLPTLISSPFALYLERLPRLWGPLPGASALGVHLEGPYLSPRYRGAHPAQHLRSPDSGEIDRLLAGGRIRMMTLAPELSEALPAVHRLRAGGVVASLGHSDATFEQGQRALAAGAKAGTHLLNAMRPFHHRDPGLAGLLLVDERAIVGIIADLVHLHPGALQLAYSAKGAEGLALVTDAISAAAMPAGTYGLGELQVRVRAGEARLADGTLAGSALTLDTAVRNMIAAVGCPLHQAVAMASATPARLLDLANKGRLTPGADADVVVLSPDLEVQQTYVGGRLVAAPRSNLEPGGDAPTGSTGPARGARQEQ